MTGEGPPRRILLVDADAFFVAVARRADPEGAGRAKLLIVGGAPGSRGVVCSASYETRAFGVRSAMPIARALRLCPDALCVPVPRAACARTSKAIAAVLERFAPIVEAASIDEWYLDLSGTEALYHHAPLAEVAAEIRRAVLQETGMSVSIGGGTNRLVAKLAVELAKPSRPAAQGVHVCDDGGEAHFLHRFALGDLPGVGPRFREQLAARGLFRVPDVLPHNLEALCRWFGERAGAWLFARVRGVGDDQVHARQRPRSISREDTFSADVSSDDTLSRALQRLTGAAAADLRRHGLTARTVTVKLRDADFRTRSASRTLSHPASGDRIFFAQASELLASLRQKRRMAARLIGIALSSLDEAGSDTQLGLFDDVADGESPKERALTAALDRVRHKFGASAVRPARLIED